MSRSPVGLCDEKASLSGKKWKCIHSIGVLFFLLGNDNKALWWSLHYASIYSGNALKLYLGLSASCRTSTGLWGALRIFPNPSVSSSVSTVSQLFPHIFYLPFVLWLYHSSLFLSLPLLLMRSLITASPLCSPRTPSYCSSFSPFPTRISLMVDTHFLSCTPPCSPSFYLPRARSCCQSNTFGLGCLMYTEPSSSFTSIIMKCGKQQRINASTFLLLQLFIIHCIFMLQWETISMAIHAGALLRENINTNRELLAQDYFSCFNVSVTSLVIQQILLQSTRLNRGQLWKDYRPWNEGKVFVSSRQKTYNVLYLLESLVRSLSIQPLSESVHLTAQRRTEFAFVSNHLQILKWLLSQLILLELRA